MNNSDLKFLNWNVRGLNCAARRDLNQQTQLHIVCLQETKLSQIDDQLKSEFMGQSYWRVHCLPTDKTRGGIAIAWNRDFITATQPVMKTHTLTMTLTVNLTNTSFMLTMVYGPTEHSEKTGFLTELISCQPSQTTATVSISKIYF
jgi:exonuclease III